MRLLPRAALLAALVLASAAVALQLNVTAIGAATNASTLECWQMATPFTVSTQPGTAGSAQLQLGDGGAGMSYSVLPAQFEAGVHNAPANQWVVFLSGLAHITLPHDPSAADAYVAGGQFGLLFAADTAAVSGTGHNTSYPGTAETVVLQIPTAGGAIPAHTCLHAGPCSAADYVGVLALAVAGA